MGFLVTLILWGWYNCNLHVLYIFRYSAGLDDVKNLTVTRILIYVFTNLLPLVYCVKKTNKIAKIP